MRSTLDVRPEVPAQLVAGGRAAASLKAVSCTAKADFMTTETTFLVQAFSVARRAFESQYAGPLPVG